MATEKYLKYIDDGIKLIGELQPLPIGTTGPTGPAGSSTSAYGEMYISTSTGVIGLTTTPIGIVDFVGGTTSNVTYVNDVTADRLRADIDGVYHIIGTFSIDLSASADNMNFEIYKNGIATGITRSVVDVATILEVTISGLISLNATDFVSIYMYVDTGTRDITILQSNFTIIKVN